MLHRPPLIARLRRSLPAVRLAVALLVMQTLAAADHLSALAAVAGGGPLGGRLGIFGLCTPLPASGVRGDGERSVPANGSVQACPVCSMASASGNAICAEADPLPLPSGIIAADHSSDWEDSHASAPSHRFGVVRGPPVPVFA